MSPITITATIIAPVSTVWEFWTKENHIMNWNFATTEWHCPSAKNDLTKGGEFHYTMAAKDNSMSFDFWGTYQKIEIEKLIEIVLGDQRKMSVYFESTANGTLITETFDPEQENPIELQQTGWKMILDNFKKYVEENSNN
jgi:uncharacterized protein YndB with AHSA1/START domain